MKSTYLICLALTLLAQSVLAEQKQCRALVLSAGGDLGSFEAGAVQALVDLLPAQEVQYDVFVGVSIGSINSLGLSQFAKGEEKQMASWLVDLWTPLKRTDIYKSYPGGIIQGLLYEKGIFDSTPAYNLLKRVMTQRPKRMLSMGTCDLRTGDFVRYNESLPQASLIDAALASGSVPAFFPYSTFDNHIYVDGGTTGIIVDISGAIHRCREVVDDDSQITVDVIFVQYAKLDFWTTNKKQKVLSVAQRSNAIQAYTKHYRELIEAREFNPNVNFRHIIKPLKALYTPQVPFLFSHAQMQQMLQQGYSDATYWIQQGPEGNAEEMVKQAKQELLVDLNIPSSEVKVGQGSMGSRFSHYNKLKAFLKV